MPVSNQEIIHDIVNPKLESLDGRGITFEALTDHLNKLRRAKRVTVKVVDGEPIELKPKPRGVKKLAQTEEKTVLELRHEDCRIQLDATVELLRLRGEYPKHALDVNVVSDPLSRLMDEIDGDSAGLPVSVSGDAGEPGQPAVAPE